MQDPAYRARFQKLSQEVHGADPARQTIGWHIKANRL
jgi:hypothetical protein